MTKTRFLELNKEEGFTEMEVLDKIWEGRPSYIDNWPEKKQERVVRNRAQQLVTNNAYYEDIKSASAEEM